MARGYFQFKKRIQILSGGSAVGELEARGPLRDYFDLTSSDSKFGMDTWEKAEAEMCRQSHSVAIKKAGITADDIDVALAGDLTNQCAASTFGMKDKEIPFVGLYGACSTFALSLGMGSLLLEGGDQKTVLCASSSHFCSAERQYRFPLEYGCQRPPTAQTTVSTCGSVVLSAASEEKGIRITEFLVGTVRDYGIRDASNMGAAMAPACADTLCRYFLVSGRKPEDFDMILTGDLGKEGSGILRELCRIGGVEISRNHDDCGNMIFDPITQDVKSGGSGCGCSAAVFASYILHRMKKAEISDILLVGTGALLSAGTVLQKETIPGVAHLIRIQREGK